MEIKKHTMIDEDYVTNDIAIKSIGEFKCKSVKVIGQFSSESVSVVTTMTELERKFILMARIANALKRKGINSSVGYVDDFEACAITVRLSHHKEENYQLEHITSLELSEEQLLEWWSVIEGEK